MTGLPTATLGRTGLEVSRLGFGAMELRGEVGGWSRPIDAADAGRLLHQVVDAGINLIDTAPDYAASEELIGQHLADRRDEVVIATKCGCPIDPEGRHLGFGEAAHTYTQANIRANVEQSLRRLRTDHLDIVQIHGSPSRAQLEADDSIAELEQLRDEGKLRFIGMSGILPNVTDHIEMGVFDVFQIPYSALERDHESVIAAAAAAGAGTIVRGGVARGLPRSPDDPANLLPEAYRPLIEGRVRRFDEVHLDDLLDGASEVELLLRFTLSDPNVHTVIVGTANPAHVAANVAAAARGPLPADVHQAVLDRLGTA